MDDEKVATFVLQIEAYNNLLKKHLHNYEKNLLYIGNIQVDILLEITTMLHDIEKSLPTNKLEELRKPIINALKNFPYYLEQN